MRRSVTDPCWDPRRTPDRSTPQDELTVNLTLYGALPGELWRTNQPAPLLDLNTRTTQADPVARP